MPRCLQWALLPRVLCRCRDLMIVPWCVLALACPGAISTDDEDEEADEDEEEEGEEDEESSEEEEEVCVPLCRSGTLCVRIGAQGHGLTPVLPSSSLVTGARKGQGGQGWQGQACPGPCTRRGKEGCQGRRQGR